MKIEQIKIEDLKPYKLNAKKHSQEQIEGIAESIKRFGFTQPVVTDKKNNIVIGHGRIDAAKLVGLKEVPCVVMDKLTPVEIKALRLIDNRIAETGWDDELLRLDLDDIDFDFENFNVSFDLNEQVEEIEEDIIFNDHEFCQMTFTMTKEQKEQVEDAIKKSISMGLFVDTGNENKNGNAIARIAETFLTKNGN